MSAVTSCGDTTVENNNELNVVEGKWNVYTDSGTIQHQRVYSPDFYAYFLIIDGQIIDNPQKEKYIVYGNNELMFDRYVQTFEIKKDTLYITNSSKTKTTKYIREKNNLIK